MSAGSYPAPGRLRAANGNRLNKWVKEASYRRSMSTAALLKNKTIIWCSPSGCQRRRSFPTWRCSPRWPIAAGWLFQEFGARELIRHRGQTDGSEFSDKCWQSGSRPALHKSAFCNGNRDKARRAIGGFFTIRYRHDRQHDVWDAQHVSNGSFVFSTVVERLCHALWPRTLAGTNRHVCVYPPIHNSAPWPEHSSGVRLLGRVSKYLQKVSPTRPCAGAVEAAGP